MAYQINKTDGTIVATVADGQIDTLSTDITLIGKNYSGFGEAFNENLVKILEKNDLFLKKIGKTIRKILVNFESKLPIDKIIFFYGISNFKERLLLYLS